MVNEFADKPLRFCGCDAGSGKGDDHHQSKSSEARELKEIDNHGHNGIVLINQRICFQGKLAPWCLLLLISVYLYLYFFFLIDN